MLLLAINMQRSPPSLDIPSQQSTWHLHVPKFKVLSTAPASKRRCNMRGEHPTLHRGLLKGHFVWICCWKSNHGLQVFKFVLYLKLDGEREVLQHIYSQTRFLQTLCCVILSQGRVRKMCFTTCGRTATN